MKTEKKMLLPYMEAGRIEAGCDEAGRGCLAGAVYAAAVILPPDFHNDELNDSKQLSERRRYALRPIIEAEAVAWAVGVVTPEEIDRFVDIKMDISKTIARVRNENYRLILEKRYLCFMTWEQISLDMHYTNRWLRKMHERALDVVDRILLERSGCP